MAIQFRKRKKLAPGITLNVGKKGLGFRVGGRNAGVSFSPTGTRIGASAPGTGFSASKKISSSGSPKGWSIWINLAIAIAATSVILYLLTAR